MQHLGVANYSLGEQQETANDHILSGLLNEINTSFKKRSKKGFLHYTEVLFALTKHVSYSKFKKSCVESPLIKDTVWSKSKKGKYKHKQRQYKCKLSPDEKLEVQRFWECEHLSRVSPHDTFVIHRRTKSNRNADVVSVYYRKFTIKESYEKFIQMKPHLKAKCSRTTFFNLKPKWVKKPQSRFDVCPIHKEIRKFRPKLNAKMEKTTEDIHMLRAMDFHEEICDKRTKDYDTSIYQLKHGTAHLTMDFKANINLGMSNEVDSSVWFSSPQRTVFGLVALFKGLDSKLYKVIFTVVSPILNHDSCTVTCILKKIIKHPVFRHFETDKLEFWMDNAPNHFRTMEMLAGFHSLIGSNGIKSVGFEYFPEYHGKSECDRHFGLISRILKEHCSHADAKEINTTKDFLQIYNSAIRGYGGCVIPKHGAVYDELKPDDGTKLNVVSMVYFPSGIKQVAELAEQNPNHNAIRGDIKDRKKDKLALNIPYKRCTFTPKRKFTLGNYYSFSFERNQKTKETYLLAKLFKSSKLDKKKNIFPFSIETTKIRDYKIRVGIKSAAQPDYCHLQKTKRNFLFHDRNKDD
eukprot:CAMPEP_0206192516 /NCGR_PEP_ID=MMETSP0166-20121206/6007_1 /ASSEMBLY_ACC=CAM_ASM_000260 /TAXON_ID=95228 /ORGANISM="Vannella robusta, Strain DIVA3 518/3/11/1/6" /LENGTH=576 /DNA_ID=CAMNT_0053609031 /DNA_START=413 /DNA_END=2143 /DNA_ORIENTATION=-